MLDMSEIALDLKNGSDTGRIKRTLWSSSHRSYKLIPGEQYKAKSRFI
jgi:hypothetical protein